MDVGTATGTRVVSRNWSSPSRVATQIFPSRSSRMGLQLSALKPSFEANVCRAWLAFEIGCSLNNSGCGMRNNPEISDVIQRLPLWSKRRRARPLILNAGGPPLGHFGGVPSGVSTLHFAMAADFVLTDVLMARTKLKLSANHIVPSGASAIEADQTANVPVDSNRFDPCLR